MTAFERVSRPYTAYADPALADVVSTLDRLAAELREELAYVRYERHLHADLVARLKEADDLLRAHDKANLLLLEVVAGLRSPQAAIEAADVGEQTGAHHVVDEEPAG